MKIIKHLRNLIKSNSFHAIIKRENILLNETMDYKVNLNTITIKLSCKNISAPCSQQLLNHPVGRKDKAEICVSVTTDPAKKVSSWLSSHSHGCERQPKAHYCIQPPSGKADTTPHTPEWSSLGDEWKRGLLKCQSTKDIS